MQVGKTKDQGLHNKPSTAVHPGALATGTLPQYNTITKRRPWHPKNRMLVGPKHRVDVLKRKYISFPCENRSMVLGRTAFSVVTIRTTSSHVLDDHLNEGESNITYGVQKEELNV